MRHSASMSEMGSYITNTNITNMIGVHAIGGAVNYSFHGCTEVIITNRYMNYLLFLNVDSNRKTDWNTESGVIAIEDIRPKLIVN